MYSIPNILDLLARAIYADLCLLLPPPSDDTPEARHLRDKRAMTAVAHLLPENAAEAEVAVLVVAAQFRAREALRAASQPGLEPDQTRRCTAQAASMMRQADGGIRTLRRMQAERQKAETAMRPAAMERAGYWFRSASPEPTSASRAELANLFFSRLPAPHDTSRAPVPGVPKPWPSPVLENRCIPARKIEHRTDNSEPAFSDGSARRFSEQPVNLTSRRWIETCDHSDEQASSWLVLARNV